MKTKFIICLISSLLLLSISSISIVSADTATTGFLLSIDDETIDIEVDANEPFSIEVTAIDDTATIIEDYAGTITFEVSDDDEASLPSDYTFDTTDAGTKIFDLGVVLVTPGNQIITVYDLEDELILGEIEVLVKDSASSTTSNNELNENAPIIDTPTDGTIINQNIVEITGTAIADSTVYFYDGTNFIGSEETDEDGNFSYETDTLYDGSHTFTVTYENEDGDEISSEKVRITIDTTSAVLQDIELNPEEVLAGETFEISVTTEGNLTEVNAIIDQRTKTLIEDLDIIGLYTAEIIAPDEAGEYSIDIEVTDDSNNTETYQDQISLTVIEEEEETTENKAPTVKAYVNTKEGTVPLKVTFESEATDMDGEIVEYLWDFGDGETSNEENPIHTYNQEGNYTVTLTVIDNEGAKASTNVSLSGTETKATINVKSGPTLLLIALIAIAINSYFIYRKETA